MKKAIKIILIVLGIIVSLIILAVIYFRIIYQSFVMDGQSMEPNISNGTFMLVEKNPKEFSRGDIVIFTPPGKNSVYVERIIALPGEEIDFNNNEQGGFQIEKAQDPNKAILEEPYLSSGTITRGDEDYEIDADSYFVMGDNRTESSDSRVFDPISKESIIGKVVFSYQCSNIEIGSTGICIPLNFKKIVNPNYTFSEITHSEIIQNSGSSLQTYIDTEYGYSFKCLASYVVERYPDGSAGVNAGPAESGFGIYSVDTKKLSKNLSPTYLDDFANSEVNDAIGSVGMSGIPTVRSDIGESDIMIGGKPAKEIIYKNAGDVGNERGIVVYQDNNGDNIMLTIFGTYSETDNSDFTNFLNSFEFAK